jgi:hypothetical protein
LLLLFLSVCLFVCLFVVVVVCAVDAVTIASRFSSDLLEQDSHRRRRLEAHFA